MSARKTNTVRKTAAPVKAKAEPAAPPQTFWTRLAARSGTMTLGYLERAAELGHGTLTKCQARNGTPSVGVALTIARYLEIAPEDLLGADTPPELRTAAPAAPADDALRRIPLRNLTCSHLNPRRTFDDEATRELADSIVAQGLLQNLVVRRDADQPAIYWIVAGERRLRALTLLASEKRLPADLAGHGIPCRVITGTDEEHVVLALLENMQRVDVNPMEEAEALLRLQTLNPKKYSTKAIADMLGVTMRKIQYSLKIARDLAEDAREKLRAGEITMKQARILATVSAGQQADLLDDAVRGVSADELLENVTNGMFPAALAIFDVDASGLDTFTDEGTGERFIVDHQVAMVRQRAAVEAKKQELLAAGCPWVEIVNWFNPAAYPEGGSGVVIVIDWHGGVTVHENRRELSEQESAKSDDGSFLRFNADQRYYKEHDAAGAALIEAISEGITHDEARAVILFDSFVPWEHRTLTDGTPSADDRLRKLAKLIGLHGAEAGDAKRYVAGYDHLLKIHNGHAANALCSLVASKFKRPQQGWPLSPVLHFLAGRVAYTVPPILLDTAKMREERIQRWIDEAAGQTDLETAIDGAAA